MSTEQTLLERLGIDSDALSTKCAASTRFLLERKVFGNKTQEEFIDHMSGTFSPNELLFLAISYITDKTADIMNNDPAIENIVNNIATKHGMSPEIVDVIKATLGIKKQGSYTEEDND